MNLLQQIKQASIDARKVRSANASFLVTLYAEAASVGKNNRNEESTDEEVISVLKKFKANAETIINAAITLNRSDAQSQIDEATVEIALIEKFLPTMLTEMELRREIDIIRSTITEPLSIGGIMGQLKVKYPGLYDGKMASKLVRELLT